MTGIHYLKPIEGSTTKTSLLKTLYVVFPAMQGPNKQLLAEDENGKI